MLTLANPHTVTYKIIIKGIEIKLNKSKGQIIWQINKEKRNFLLFALSAKAPTKG